MNLRLLAAFPLLLLSPSALAAPATPCVPASMQPFGSSFPANLPGFGYEALNATTADVQLYSVTGAGSLTPVPLTIGPVVDGLLKVAPTTPLVAGTSYELDFKAPCNGYQSGYPPQPVKFTAAPEAPIPTQIGTLEGAPTVLVQRLGTTKFSVTASYRLAPDMQPWLPVYQLGLEVDGRVVETHQAVAATNVIQITGTGWCDAANAATSTHPIKLKARLPFAPTLETAVTSASFECPPPALGNPGASPPIPPGGVTAASGGTPSSSSSSSNGGGCSTTPGVASSSFALFGLALGFFALVRRATRKDS